MTVLGMLDLQALTELTFEMITVEVDRDILDHIDWAFLTTFPALRKLTLDGLTAITDSLTNALLAMPHLQQLHLDCLRHWRGTATHLGRLRARLAAERPNCAVSLTEL